VCGGDYIAKLTQAQYRETEELYMFQSATAMKYYLSILPLYGLMVAYFYWVHLKLLSYIPEAPELEDFKAVVTAEAAEKKEGQEHGEVP